MTGLLFARKPCVCIWELGSTKIRFDTYYKFPCDGMAEGFVQILKNSPVLTQGIIISCIAFTVQVFRISRPSGSDINRVIDQTE